jgi:hypothetical protein
LEAELDADLDTTKMVVAMDAAMIFTIIVIIRMF